MAKCPFPNHQLATNHLMGRNHLHSKSVRRGGQDWPHFPPFHIHAYPSTHVLCCELGIAFAVAVCGFLCLRSDLSLQLCKCSHSWKHTCAWPHVAELFRSTARDLDELPVVPYSITKGHPTNSVFLAHSPESKMVLFSVAMQIPSIVSDGEPVALPGKYATPRRSQS